MENQFSQQLLIKYTYYIINDLGFDEGYYFVKTYVMPFIPLMREKHKDQKLDRDSMTALALQHAIDASIVPIDIINDITEFSIRNL